VAPQEKSVPARLRPRLLLNRNHEQNSHPRSNVQDLKHKSTGEPVMRTGLKAASFALALVATISMGARAADPTSAAGEPSAATIDAIVNKLESSGALDKAIDRALSRQAQRQ